MDSWKEGYLSEITEIVMGQSPSGSNCNNNGEGTPLLNGPTEFTNRYPLPVQYTTDVRKESQINDVLFCVRGSTTGRMNWSDRQYAIGRGLAAIRHIEGVEYKNFVKGILDYNLGYLLQSATGSTFPNVSKNQLHKLEIVIPPLPEQKAIAEVFSSLDDKIDLLHRQNKTLEAMAETLFRQWFVEEADESWEDGTLGDFGTVITGKTPSKKNPEHWGESFDFITPTDFKFFGMFTDRTGRKLSNDGWNRFVNIQLPVNSILVTCIGSDMGKVAISSNSCVTNQQLNSIILNDVSNLGYVYQHIKSKYNEIRSIAFGGTTMPIINKGDFSQIDIPIPPKKLIDKFQSYWSSLSDRIRFNQKQIQTFNKLRDTLLPKLMSGEVRVKMN